MPDRSHRFRFRLKCEPADGWRPDWPRAGCPDVSLAPGFSLARFITRVSRLASAMRPARRRLFQQLGRRVLPLRPYRFEIQYIYSLYRISITISVEISKSTLLMRTVIAASSAEAFCPSARRPTGPCRATGGERTGIAIASRPRCVVRNTQRRSSRR